MRPLTTTGGLDACPDCRSVRSALTAPFLQLGIRRTNLVQNFNGRHARTPDIAHHAHA